VIPAYYHYVQSVAGPKLAQKWEQMNRKLEYLQQKDIQLSAQIHMLKTEINALNHESEESSLAARTLLGMVRPSELIYQLTAPTLGSEE
jgi:cell division protein FtsB